jgi:hypothetical protein
MPLFPTRLSPLVALQLNLSGEVAVELLWQENAKPNLSLTHVYYFSMQIYPDDSRVLENRTFMAWSHCHSKF